MYDMICAMKAEDGEYVFSTFNHVITLIELAVWASRPIVQMLSEEHTIDELELLVTRILYHYIDAVGNKDFYDRLSKCTNVDWRKQRQDCHRAFWKNLNNSIKSVQKDFPDFLEGNLFIEKKVEEDNQYGSKICVAGSTGQQSEKQI